MTINKKNLVCTGVMITCSTFMTSIQASNDDLDIDVGFRIMADADYVKDWYEQEDQFDAEIRRLQTTLKIKKQDWTFKVKTDIDIDGKDAEIDDLYLQYSGWKWASITVGKHKESFGLEGSTGSTQLTTIERSMSTQAFSPGRNNGVSLNNSKGKVNWWLGLYNNDSYDANEYALTGRTTYKVFNQNDNYLHIGGSFSLRNLDGAEYDIKSNLEVHSMDNVLNTKNQNINKLNLFGAEAQWSNGKVKLASEWYLQSLELTDSSEKIQHKGGYVQSSYLFGDSIYRTKNGKQASPKLSKNQNSWELVSRWSYLDATESENGQEVQNWNIGLNNYIGKNIKLMAGYTYSTVLTPIKQHGNALSFRAQYTF